MFRKVLIANRGEIAYRLIVACREWGVETVAVYVAADADAPYVRLADESHEVAVGGYVDGAAMIAVAQHAGVDAIHPGYGFLSESAPFAAACEDAGIVFVGPTPAAISRVGQKVHARALAHEIGVPMARGGVLGAERETWPRAADYPIMVKAAAGGGGIGLALVSDPDQLAEQMVRSRALCAAAFGQDAGDPSLYWEIYLNGARHIEVQIAADNGGEVAALGVRECSVQRRFQKLIEECPAANLPPAAAAQLVEWAVMVARAAGYRNVGTVEFLWTPEAGPHFLEFNARIQVEHPVTEWVCGIDLPQLQFRLAAGEALAPLLALLTPRGHAIEARVYAEDPVTGAPTPGRIDHVSWPLGPWVRVDAGVEAGQTLPDEFDPLLAKIIAWGPDRPVAVRRLAEAISRTVVVGTLATNLPTLRAILADEAFTSGRFDTALFGRVVPEVPDLCAEAAIGLLAIATAGTPAAKAAGVPAMAPAWSKRVWR